MNTTTASHLAAIESHDRWTAAARVSYQRLADGFAALSATDWQRPTPCIGWTVRDLGGHVVGAMRSAATLRESVSQQRAMLTRAKRTGEAQVDALTALQIERTAELSEREIVDEMQRLVEPAVRGRSRVPRFIRRRAGFRVTMPGIDERWTLDYFLDCILTRDAWLHYIDLADTLGVEPTLDDHDRAIVGDVAAEWARRHGQPVELTLTGPAGGMLSVGSDGEQITIDAVEFCRVVSGRAADPRPLLAQAVPF